MFIPRKKNGTHISFDSTYTNTMGFYDNKLGSKDNVFEARPKKYVFIFTQLEISSIFWGWCVNSFGGCVQEDLGLSENKIHLKICSIMISPPKLT